MSVWNRISYLSRRSKFDRELDAEIQFHVETRAEELEAGGLPAKEALQRARREFGPRARSAEESRAAWQLQWLEDLWRDLVYGARAFAKSPGFTTVSVLSLGIGVGATYVMFAVVNEGSLRQPNVPHPSEIVGLVSTARDSTASPISYPDYRAVRDRSPSFQGLAAFTAMSAGLAPHSGAVARLKDGKLITPDFFSVLGVRPEMGREFAPEEDSVTILSHSCWQNEFGADPAAIGRPARINGLEFTVAGVMPSKFTDVDDDLSDDEPCFYLPIRAASRVGNAPDLLENRGQRSLTVFGRLKTGVPIERARAEVATIAGTLAKDYPQTNRDRSMTVRTLLEYRSGGKWGITMFAFSMALAGMVLLVACANVAGLLTSRAPARAREMAMRLSIGAPRSRLIRQLLTESLLLAAGGAVVGIAFGYTPLALGKRLAVEFDPRLAAEFQRASINPRLLAFSIAVALLSLIIFGLAPAFQATRADPASVMKGEGGFLPRRGLLGKLFRGRNLLVAGQVAISLLLLTITSVLYAGVYKGLVTSFQNPGFDVNGLLLVDFDPGLVHLKNPRAAQFFHDLAGRLRLAKGVKGATLEYQDIAMIRPESPVAHDDVKTSGVWVDEGFFDTLGIPLIEGRSFHPADLRTSPDVAIVNHVLVRHYWPGQSAIGKQIRLATGQWVTVVGVAKLNAFMAFGTGPMDTIFLPYGMPQGRDISLTARAAGDPRALVEPIRTMIHDLDPDQAMPDARTWQNSIGIFMRAALLSLDTLGAMGVLGMLLALVGLYGLLAYEVGSRTREIGIRMALGARAGAVVRMVLRQGVALAVVGVGLGVALDWGMVKILAAVLGIGSNTGGESRPPEPNGGSQINIQAGSATFGNHGFAILVAAVFVVTIVAAYLPARRAARVDPNVALRAE
ncbi:MAG TPA: ABC transporter permease [Bryobacteraceae bacterium]|jgi:predicted permease